MDSPFEYLLRILVEICISNFQFWTRNNALQTTLRENSLYRVETQ